MNLKKYIIIIILTIFLFSIAGVSASDTNETLMTSIDDSPTELSKNNDDVINKKSINGETEDELLGAGEGTYEDLSVEIGNGGDKNLTKSHYTYTGGNTIEIRTPGVINGNGAVIDMNGSNIRAFYVGASGVTIKNLTIKNTNINARGGAIYFFGTGNVINCNFVNNSATGKESWGGAIYFNNFGTVTNCNFTDNTAYRGGAVYFLNQGNVSNCNFTGNTASHDGGAVRMSSGSVSNCNFTDNTATGDGGAIYFLNQGTVTNCNFTDNTANDGGGAVYFSRTGNVTNCNFAGNTAGRGGAVYFSSTGTVSNCNFINNTAIVDGGAVFFNETGIVSYCNFNNNFASLNGGAIYFNISGSTHIVTNCNFTDNKASDIYSYGGAILMHSGTVKNCNFNNNIVLDRESCGGAVFFWNWGNVSNCNFTGNTANQGGGAVYFLDAGNVLNCNFMGNTAANGGAVFFKNRGDVLNCNFINNTAYSWGGAVYFDEEGTVTNCNFVNNHANKGGSILSLKWWTVTADTCIFKTDSDSPYNTHNLPPTLNVDNFTTVYGSGEKLTFDLKTNSSIPVTNGNILISVYFKDNGEWVRNYTCLSGEGWIPDLPVGSYIVVFDTEYAEFQKINRTVTITMPNVRYSINVSSVTTNNKTVNITAKTDIPKNILWDGKLLFILPNNINITANYAGNGTWWANYTFNEYSEYEISALYIGLDNVTVNNATLTIIKANSTLTINDIVFDYGGTGSTTVNYTNALGINASVIGQPQAVVIVVNNTIFVSGLDIGSYILSVTTVVGEDYNPVTQTANITVNKAKTVLTANAVTTVYNVNKYLTITLKDVYGNPLKDVEVGVNFNGVKYLTTDKNGQIKIPTKVVSPNKYNVKITFDGNANYLKSSTSSKVVIKKASSKITAAKKTFKAKTKVKKYAVVLKDITNSPIINTKLTLKVKGKTYSAKTNYKGKAVFKITKLNKKGTYKAVIKFNGNKYYLKSTKNTKITVKASKTTFKTVSRQQRHKNS